MKQSRFPPGWDEERVRRLITHYEEQTEEEAIAEDEAAFEEQFHTVMEVPKELMPAIRELIARHQA
jgi:aminoglycoside/choline kinase family phosphotransferase